MAVRNGASLNFLLNDHLGSTSIILKTNGALWGELRYSAWGEPRYSNGTIVTDRQYTGQINDGDTGLYYYNARYYDPALHKFIQADTIVPDPSDPQSLNRFSYTFNNPVKYTDPSGHSACAGSDDACWQAEYNGQVEYYLAHGYELINQAWKFTGNFHNEWVADDTLRRHLIRDFAGHLAGNGTEAGEALAQITAFAASFYESIDPLGIIMTGSFVDDISFTLTGMGGGDIVVDFLSGNISAFIGQDKYPDTDLLGIYRDNTANQAYHFWFFVAVSYHNNPLIATAGNLKHEIDPREYQRSWQDFALSVAATDLGYKLSSRQMSFHSVSSWIRLNLTEWWK